MSEIFNCFVLSSIMPVVVNCNEVSAISGLHKQDELRQQLTEAKALCVAVTRNKMRLQGRCGLSLFTLGHTMTCPQRMQKPSRQMFHVRDMQPKFE